MNNTHFQRHAVLYGFLLILCAQQFISQFTGHVPGWIIDALKYIVTCAGIIGPYLAKPPEAPSLPKPAASPQPATAVRELQRTSTGAMVSLAIALFLCCGMTGCAGIASSTAKTIDAATTTLTVTDATGKAFAISFPKELQSKTFSLDVNPSTGEVKVSADSIQTSSTQIIQAAGTAEANAMAIQAQANAQFAQSVMPLVQSAATAAASVYAPAAVPVIKALTTPPPAAPPAVSASATPAAIVPAPAAKPASK